MARNNIRGVQLPDKTYALTGTDIHYINDNFIQLSKEIFGNSDFTRNVEKQVKKNTENIEAITMTVGDLEGDYGQLIVDVDEINIEVGSKLNEADFTGNAIASKINLTSTTIKLIASKIQFEGLVTANTNFKINLDGSIEAKNAILSGAITATKMVAVSSDDYFGEVGISDGIVGLGLYDMRYSTQPYMKIGEVATGTGFALYDRNDVQRLIASAAQTTLRDQNDKILLYTEGINRFLMAPNSTTYLAVTDIGVQVVKNGVVIAEWGY